jgi:hypothetical protein
MGTGGDELITIPRNKTDGQPEMLLDKSINRKVLGLVLNPNLSHIAGIYSFLPNA